MCGIYLTNIKYKDKEISRKLDFMQFRGPDNKSIYKSDGLIFGHLRLKILDLDKRSNQPMHFNNLTIVFNGEIYNYKDIKKELKILGYNFKTTSDTEVIIKSFHQWGPHFIKKLNGMFAISIFDRKTKKIYCYRDRLGVKPFYYYWKDGIFEICSQLKPISDKKKLSNKAISVYLDCGYIPSPMSIFQDINKLGAGHILEIDLRKNTISNSSYWDLHKPIITNLSYDKAKSTLHNLLIDAVKIRLNSDVPIGTFLSGGIDSALVTSIAQKISKTKIKTFTVGFDEKDFDESKVANKFAEILSTDHNHLRCKSENILELFKSYFRSFDEPFADNSALPSLVLNKYTKKKVTVALSGDGGDESFFGYNHFEWLRRLKIIFFIPQFLRKFLSFFVLPFIFKGRTEPLKLILRLKNIKDFIPEIFIGLNRLTKIKDNAWIKKYKYHMSSSNIYQMCADLNIKMWLEADSNVKVDRASMAYSVEVRSPFLDYRIIEFARTLPLKFRFNNGNRKKIIKDILEEYIPKKYFNQPKKGFGVPIRSWIRNELRTEIESNLSDDFLNIVPNLDVIKFKKMLYKHMLGKHNYAAYIWRVYILSKWYQEFGFYKNER